PHCFLCVASEMFWWQSSSESHPRNRPPKDNREDQRAYREGMHNPAFPPPATASPQKNAAGTPRPSRNRLICFTTLGSPSCGRHALNPIAVTGALSTGVRSMDTRLCLLTRHSDADGVLRRDEVIEPLGV